MKYISLGKNCEVSYQIERIIGKPIYSSLFSWAYVLDDINLINALNSIEQVFTDNISFHMPSNDMFIDRNFGITFHGRIPKQEFIDPEGNIYNKDKYDEALAETRNRVDHLKNKFIKDLTNDEDIFVYLYKLQIVNKNDGSCIDKKVLFLQQLSEYFVKRKKGAYLICVIVEKDVFETINPRLQQCDNLFIETVDFFAPDNDSQNGADFISYDRIIESIELFYKKNMNLSEFLKIKSEYNGEDFYRKTDLDYSELEKKVAWLKNQMRNNRTYIDSLNKENKELSSWCNELAKGNEWLKQQMTFLDEENKELHKWCDEQNKAKEWLVEQNQSLQEEIKLLKKVYDVT